MHNMVFLIGRLVDDPELKEISDNKKVINIPIAVHRNFKNENGEYDTDFFKCTMWNNIAHNVSEYAKKGDLVGIKGRLQSNNYEDKDGVKHYTTEIIVEKVTFLNSAKQNKVNLCKYCGKETDSKDENVLCQSCRESFGHTFYNEL